MLDAFFFAVFAMDDGLPVGLLVDERLVQIVRGA